MSFTVRGAWAGHNEDGRSCVLQLRPGAAKCLFFNGARDESMYLWTPYLTKEAKIYNGEKTNSLTSGAGKTGQPHVKE